MEHLSSHFLSFLHVYILGIDVVKLRASKIMKPQKQSIDREGSELSALESGKRGRSCLLRRDAGRP